MKLWGRDTALSLLHAQVSQWGIYLTAEQGSSLASYADLLVNYQLANVIGTRNRTTILLEHITDALSALASGKISEGDRIIDVGTGGGLPGIPLHIARPSCKTVLAEATAKKARFLDLVVERLNLNRVEVVNERAEVLGRRAQYRDAFDVAVARAVATLPVVVEYCAPLVRNGGVVIAMKGKPTRQELNAGSRAASALGAKLEKVHHVSFRPEMVQKKRQLVVFRKCAPTPERFPRRVGLAKQQPLGSGGQR